MFLRGATGESEMQTQALDYINKVKEIVSKQRQSDSTELTLDFLLDRKEQR